MGTLNEHAYDNSHQNILNMRVDRNSIFDFYCFIIFPETDPLDVYKFNMYNPVA